LLDSGVYHCQQAAEKALKGWLTSKEVEFHKTHDLVELLNQSIPLNKELASFDTAARNLAPFSVRFRYPGDTFEPPLEEAIQALGERIQISGFRDLCPEVRLSGIPWPPLTTR
ncbi:MAG TPA: HEPN domain-containing protein, partial [Chryseolinea sp.]